MRRNDLTTRSAISSVQLPDSSREPFDLTTRTLSLRADSIDDQARSVEAVLSTENPAQVYDWATDRVIDETLVAGGADPFHHRIA